MDATERFEALLAEYAGAGARREQVRQRMWEAFGRRCAVFVSDLSGFSRLSERYNVIHFLSMIWTCRQLLLPMIRAAGGSPVKTAADNVYAIFPDAGTTIETSIAMMRRLAEHNVGVDPDEQIFMSVGIGYGDVLLVENQDFFGHELNLAFKLGEDTAAPGEILVTRAALEAAGPGRFPYEERSVSVSGVTIPHGAIRYG